MPTFPISDVERGKPLDVLDAAVERLARFGGDAGVAPPEIRVAKYGDLATAAGGAAFALHALLRPFGHDNGALRIKAG